MDPAPRVIDLLYRSFDWLKKLQVNIPDPELSLEQGKWYLAFNHPIHGSIKCSLPEEGGYVQLNGLVFNIEWEHKDNIPVVSCIDHGAIYDPIEERVPGEHYGTSHFALLCAILFELTKETHYIANIERTLDFYLNRGNLYPFAIDGQHWEFDNFAWAQIYKLIKNNIPGEALRKIKTLLDSPPQHKIPFATNWKLLAVNFLLSYQDKPIINRLIDKMRVEVYFRMVRANLLADGCIEDIRGRSRSIQYHAMSGALIALLEEDGLKSISKKIVLSAANYLSTFLMPDGDFNYKGRGQRQIFGYAPAVYLLLRGSQLAEEIEESKRLEQAARYVYRYISSKQREDGSFPLVLNGLEDEKKAGWHDYHYLTVYNAFVAAWFGLTFLKSPLAQFLHKSPLESARFIPRVIFHKPSETLIWDNGSLSLCLSAGEDYYETDCGLSPHTIFAKDIGPVVCCPGGADKDKFGRKYRSPDLDFNFLAPLLLNGDEVVGPGRHKGQLKNIEGHKNRFIVSLRYLKNLNISREIIFHKYGFQFLDEIQIKHGFLGWRIIPFNLPVLQSKRYLLRLDEGNVELITNCGRSLRIIIDIMINGQVVACHINRKINTVSAAGLVTVLQSNPHGARIGKTLNVTQEWHWASKELNNRPG